MKAKLWEISGKGKSGQPCRIRVRAADYAEAEQIAMKRRVAWDRIALVDEGKRFKPTGDEQADTAAFEEFMGGVERAQRLLGIYKRSGPGVRLRPFDKPPTRAEVFRAQANMAGFTDSEVDALLAMQ